MKKIILTFAAVFAFGFANAQEATTTDGGFAKGDLFLTGSFGISSEKTGDDKSNSFTVAPSLGYFVSDKIAIGGRILYTSDKAESGNVDTQDLTTLGIAGFARYYWTPANKFSIFGEAEVAYVSAENNLTDVKGNGFGLGLAPGVSYFLSSNFAIEASWGLVGYNTFEVDGAQDSTNTFNFGLDLSDLRFGLIYKF
jgi:outer membrane protein